MRLKDGLCCDDCYKMIHQKDVAAAVLWTYLCKLHLHANIFGLESEDDETIRLLETMGFITTTETDEVIVIRVNGFRTEGTTCFYCGGICDQ